MWRHPASRYLVLGGLALAATGPLAAAASPFCVSRLGEDSRTADGGEARSVGPTRFEPSRAVSTPLAFDEVRDDLQDGEHYNVTKRYWRYGADRQFEGPHTSGYQLEVVGSDGRLIYLKGGRYATDAQSRGNGAEGKHWQERLFVARPGGVPEMVGGILARPQWTYDIEGYREDLGGVVVRSSINPASGPSTQSYLLATGTIVRPISEDAARPHTLFPRWNLSVSTGGNFLRLIGPNRLGRQLRLPHTDDFEEWESLNIDRYGWLFAEGWGNDYAIKWKHRDSGIAVERVVRYTGSGWFARLARWFLSTEEEAVSSTHYSAQCVDFSPVLQLTIFCKPAKVLREGELEDIGNAVAPLKRYVGDATGARVALFRGEDQGLYAFDGEAVQKVSARFDAVHDFPEAKRTFVAGPGVASELVGRFPRLRLRKIEVPETERSFDFPPAGTGVHFLPGHQEPLIFTAGGVWTVQQGGVAQSLWQAEDSPVQVSEVTPAGVWKGLIFRTQAGRTMLIRSCGPGRDQPPAAR